ncbi:MAG TPA: hypothetical protein VHF89_16710 [Solirubrobacteraceae bacterium]|nr:hypothetical protein [Solirubrobacteraceae bacterium]
MEERAPDREPLDELAALADELLHQATDVRRQWAELGETLGLEPAPQPRAQQPAEEPRPAPAEWPEADPVRLVALDMMLSGKSRAEVSEYLRATFGEDVRPDVLDEIFTDEPTK